MKYSLARVSLHMFIVTHFIEIGGDEERDKTRFQASTKRESVDRESVVTQEFWQVVISTVRKLTYKNIGYVHREDVENIAAYAIEFAWADWNPSRGVPFMKFFWTQKDGLYIYIQKAIDRQITEHGAKRKRWYREVPSIWISDDGKEHSIEDFADPADLESQFLWGEMQNYYDVADASQFATWIINEINSYVEYLVDICDIDKLYVLYALCKKDIRLKDVAHSKGLSHENMSPTVAKVCNDLSQRMGIPRMKLQFGLDIIRSEPTLSSQITITLGMNI